MLTFSIVINTLNRATLLQRTLDSFRGLHYAGDFEVIVVNGPSRDNTDQVVQEWLPGIRAGSCAVANLSMSRNVGICMARGDIVAFIDDDAIPEPEWLTQLSSAYDLDEIGGAGGLVFGPSGYSYQYEYSTANRLGNANWKRNSPAEHLCFPGSYEFPYLQGTNASFRRSALIEVGGFDEEIEYYLDETEVCCRLIDAGYVIRQLANAYVHHKFAPSHVRDEHKITRYRYPVIKNKIYFSLKHAQHYLDVTEILDDGRRFIDAQANDVEFHIAGGRLDEAERGRLRSESSNAVQRALERGLSTEREMITAEKLAFHKGSFVPFKTLSTGKPKSIVIVSRDFPPAHGGGIATFSKDLAEALSALGNIVHVITQSPDVNRVDLENGVWLHRMVPLDVDPPLWAREKGVPQRICNWSIAALMECHRIATHRKIDVVEAPIWDCEGVAFLFEGVWPLVTSLQTTLYFWLETHPEFQADRKWMAEFGTPMLSLERELMSNSDAIRSISAAIRDEIENAYCFKFDENAVQVAPLGMREPQVVSKSTDGQVYVLFVGRLETRKGIDVLLDVIPMISSANPSVRFIIIGDNALPGSNGVPFSEQFLAEHRACDWLSRVEFRGKVSDEELQSAYAACDIFVAPSRFESFGLVFLEAMRVGKPVIGCRAGGMPEIISDGENGMLVSPGDSAELSSALTWMIEHPEERARMGQAGRRIFETVFTSDKMADRSLDLYELAARRHGAR